MCNTVIVYIKPDASQDEIRKTLETLEKSGVFGNVTQFDGATVIIALTSRADFRASDSSLNDKVLESPWIDKIVKITDPFPLASRSIRDKLSVIQVGSLTVGDGNFGIIAGPCTVESESQTLKTAVAVKKAGANALRGGAFKPRTSPYVFQGLKEAGLKILAKARDETGLAIVTEAMAPEEVPLVAEYADVVQIGTRNAQNYRLLEAVGRIRKPVMLKRGFSCTHEEFLMSAEYILAGGNQQVILCERGIRTFETYVRFTLPLAIIPELHSKTHLPVVVDPSHAAGKSSLVIPMAVAATAAGADGLLVEVHPEPESALCDGRQSLTPKEFEKMAKLCRSIHPLIQGAF